MKLILTAIALIAGLFAGSANAAFVNSFALDNWQKIGAGGSVSGTSSTLTLVSNNDGNTANNVFDYSIKILATGLITFDWNYITTDTTDTKVGKKVTRQAGPKNDKFGYVLNNNPFVQLSSNGNNKFTQAGSIGSILTPAILVNVNDEFKFRVVSSDSIGGAATITVNNFVGPEPVPVPAAIWLFAVPMLAVLRRKK